jgi:tRNA wybutosine-synthesizing protein 2
MHIEEGRPSPKRRAREFRELILDNLDIPGSKVQYLPRGFQRIGHIVILKLHPEVSSFARDIAELVLGEFPYARTVCLAGDVSGELREPSVRYIAGEKGTETTHQENYCRFMLDVAKVMFSKGNLSERGRIPRLVKHGEVVADLFAGIGYFSIPIAKNSMPGHVYSIEKNPSSFQYLKENIRLNGVQAVVTPILGDCRKVKLGSIADRVIMGYLPETRHYLPFAFGSLKPGGGTIHYHDNFHESELWEKPIRILETNGFRAGYELKRISRMAKVKEYSPMVYHAVLDAEFVKA